MATNTDFAKYVVDQLSLVGDITCKKMFGEYGLYYKEKIFALICDDQLFIKITENGKKVLGDYELAPPYQGSKPYFLISDIEDRELLRDLTLKTYEELPTPKPKKKKKIE